jgi:hypothetical protein
LTDPRSAIARGAEALAAAIVGSRAEERPAGWRLPFGLKV